MPSDLGHSAQSQPFTHHAKNDYSNLLDQDFVAVSQQQARLHSGSAQQQVKETRTHQARVGPAAASIRREPLCKSAFPVSPPLFHPHEAATTPKTEELMKAARGVDALFVLPELLNLPHDDVRRHVTTLFETPEDLFIANVLALSESWHRGSGREFDFATNYVEKKQEWEMTRGSGLSIHLNDFQQVQQGNWRRIAFPSVWKLQQSQFARTRRPLVNRLQQSAKPKATSPPVAADNDTGMESAWKVPFDEDEDQDGGSDEASDED
ncbi:hypothetical protein EJ03DRAFT_353080 [Teratosphaeria nubilosa]|uniref:Uncharacterized protein n=1 Tax=Teratosphaeria nubilosa TaxID=161662 RepID=A0A6G1L4G7_9PEZI|nr:hypothetical protein EJ03DRAFT_353080 [Teratosphaeria nubilosa]